MASFNVAGFEDVEMLLLQEAKSATKAVPLMLKAGADVLVKAQKSNLKSFKVVDKEALLESIKASKVTRKDAESIIFVRPTGTDAKGVRNAEKGFIAEYGKHGQAARPWMQAANEKSENAVHDAMITIWEGAKDG